VTDGKVTTIRLADDSQESVSTTATGSQDRLFRRAGATFGADFDPVFTTQHSPTNHTDQVQLAAEQVGVGSSAGDIYLNADEPDKYGCDCDVSLGFPTGTPPTLVNGLQAATDKTARHAEQYYDPNVGINFDGDFHDLGAIGGAPGAGQYRMDKTRNNSSYTRRKNLGYATHYVSDLGVPLHTGMGAEQANLQFNCGLFGCDYSLDPRKQLHSAYEGYIAGNWESTFKSDFENGNTPDIISTSQVIKDTADHSSRYSYVVYQDIMREGNQWEDWSDSTKSDIKERTANCMLRVGFYTRGFLSEFY
jgi:hypothetical protein